MALNLQQKRAKQNGFTLVEVIVVLVILAILAAILIPSLVGYINKANEKKAIAECRAAVNAAQTISSEKYGIGETGIITSEVLDLAELKGNISWIQIEDNSAAVSHLVYTPNTDPITVTYCRNPEPDNCTVHNKTYTFSEATSWALGQDYSIGDTMISGGYIFQCIRAHTTGTTSRTRDPANRSNKSTWEVISTTDGKVPIYSSTVRFAEGMIVSYKGKTYMRTYFNLVGGQVPYEDKDSDYWILLE